MLTAAVAAGCAIALLSLGSWVVLALMLAVAASDGVASAVLIASCVAVAARLGSTALATVAGTQAVLGPAVMTGPPAAAASAALVGVAILLVSPRGIAAVPFGLAAALIVAGPAVGGGTALLVRLLAAAGCIELAVAAAHMPAGLARWRTAVAGVAGVMAVALGFVARPSGGGWSLHAGEFATGVAAAALAAGITSVALILNRHRLSAEAEGE